MLAHSLDEHKRLAVAKQNQEMLLAEHFAKVNLADPSGEKFESDNFKASSSYGEKKERKSVGDALLACQLNPEKIETNKDLEENIEIVQLMDPEKVDPNKEATATDKEVGENPAGNLIEVDENESNLIEADESPHPISKSIKSNETMKGLEWLFHGVHCV